MSVRMDEDALLLQRLLRAVNEIQEERWHSSGCKRLVQPRLNNTWNRALQQITRKQYLDVWLIGQVNLFSTSYGSYVEDTDR
jgi:hypothetical protein